MALFTYAGWYEALIVVSMIGLSFASHVRNLDVAFAVGYGLVVLGPFAIVLGGPAAFLVASVIWMRRHSKGIVKVGIETAAITAVVGAVWGTAIVLAMMLAGLIEAVDVPAALVFGTALGLPAIVPAVLSAGLLHSGRLTPEPGPVW